MRAGDDQDGDDAFNSEGAGCAERQPRDKGHASGSNSDDCEQECGAISQRLGARARGLRLLDEPHVGKRRPLARARDLDAKRTGAIHRSGDDLRTLDLLDGTDSP
jgi:hypothetical protein